MVDGADGTDGMDGKNDAGPGTLAQSGVFTGRTARSAIPIRPHYEGAVNSLTRKSDQK